VSNDAVARGVYREQLTSSVSSAGSVGSVGGVGVVGNNTIDSSINNPTPTTPVSPIPPMGQPMGFMPVWDIMVDLWDIHKYIVNHNVTKLNMKEYLNLKNNINTAPTTTTATATATGIASTERLKSLFNLKFELSNEAVGVAESDGYIPLYRIYVDGVHPQPWVYDQINNAFLNAVCVI